MSDGDWSRVGLGKEVNITACLPEEPFLVLNIASEHLNAFAVSSKYGYLVITLKSEKLHIKTRYGEFPTNPMRFEITTHYVEF